MTAFHFTRRRDEVEGQLRELFSARGIDPDDENLNIVAADDDEELRSLLVAWQASTNEVRAFFGLYAQTPELPTTAAERKARDDRDWPTHDRLVEERKAAYSASVDKRVAANRAALSEAQPDGSGQAR